MSKEKDLILKAADLDPGDALFIEAATKKEQTKQFTRLYNYAKEYMDYIDPDIKLIVFKTIRDKRLWIAIEKQEKAQDLWVRKADGTTKAFDETKEEGDD